MRTFFIDVDGTIFKQKPNLSNVLLEEMELLPGVIEFFNKAVWNNDKIILTTGRKESTREITEKQLAKAGLFYDTLIMGLDAGGTRVLINNLRENNEKPTAVAINIKQDEGLGNVG
jgi:hypothetical protein